MASPDKNVEQHELSDTSGENQIIRFTHFVFNFYFFLTEKKLTYSIMLVSSKQHSELTFKYIMKWSPW